ncbi:hypothetical protein M422DRAFT_37616 [Sphaerobolus stellatus SS14]|uniref:DUF6699 domain-containing protein n=1 Tax=Sphaerobolus stellatus (strain SS14) TaxID=990650 RepID=A0A0C9UR75_SPHS4|nr:hypothetical protein M422DRAFT_37616 [Sphaerobolus stellatus SS14]
MAAHYPTPPSSNFSTTSSSRRVTTAPRMSTIPLPIRDDVADAFYHSYRAFRETCHLPQHALHAPVDDLRDISPPAPFAPPRIPIPLPPMMEDYSSQVSSSSLSTRSRSSSSRSSSRYSILEVRMHDALSTALIYDFLSKPRTARVVSSSPGLHLMGGSRQAGPSSTADCSGGFPFDEAATYPAVRRLRVDVEPHQGILVDASDNDTVTCGDVLRTVHRFLWAEATNPSLDIEYGPTLQAYQHRVGRRRDVLRNIDFLKGKTGCLRFRCRQSSKPEPTLVLVTTRPTVW